MSFEKAKKFLDNKGFGDRVKVFEVSSATVELAAAAIGCENAHIAKSMSFYSDGGAILVVTAGDTKIDNRKFKETFFTKAKMIAFEEVEKYVGHAVGGVCPFGVNDGVRVCFDVSLKRFDYIYPACGSDSSAVKLSCEELEKAVDSFEWVDVCKTAENISV